MIRLHMSQQFHFIQPKQLYTTETNTSEIIEHKRMQKT